MKKTKLIPFGLLPAAWGLRGKSRLRAEAEYYYEGYDLEIQLAELDNDDKADFELAKLKINLEHGKMSQRDYDYDIAKRITNETERELALLDLDYKYTDMKEAEYEKRQATIKKESWVKIIHVDANGSFEFDWNTAFIDELEEKGFGPAPKEEMVVDEWFNEICKNITIEQYQGDVALLAEQIDEREPNLVRSKVVAPGKREVK